MKIVWLFCQVLFLSGNLSPQYKQRQCRLFLSFHAQEELGEGNIWYSKHSNHKKRKFLVTVEQRMQQGEGADWEEVCWAARLARKAEGGWWQAACRRPGQANGPANPWRGRRLSVRVWQQEGQQGQLIAARVDSVDSPHRLLHHPAKSPTLIMY